VAVKSIVDIDIRDGEFTRFYATFQQYQQHLQRTPMAWANIAKAQNKSAAAFQDLVALEVQSMGHQKMMLQVQQAAARLTRTNADVWRDMSRTTKTVAGNITSATLQLAKWSGIVGVVGGLVGAGGLFGIERLAQGVASRRRDRDPSPPSARPSPRQSATHRGSKIQKRAPIPFRAPGERP
jgi:hypothetical protein